MWWTIWVKEKQNVWEHRFLFEKSDINKNKKGELYKQIDSYPNIFPNLTVWSTDDRESYRILFNKNEFYGIDNVVRLFSSHEDIMKFLASLLKQPIGVRSDLTDRDGNSVILSWKRDQ